MRSDQMFVIAAKIAAGPVEVPALSADDIDEAIKSFKWEIKIIKGEEDYGSEVKGTFNLHGIEFSFHYDPDQGDFYLKLENGEMIDDRYDESNFDEIISYYLSKFDWNPVFKALQNKYEAEIEDGIRDKIYDIEGSKAEALDPYGYRGVSRSDFL
jgi:hypothetical protein